jgi:hypothetical protein
MTVTVSHNRCVEDVKRSVDRSFDEIFTGLPTGPIQITDEQRTWNACTLAFSFTARAAFMAVPIRGTILVEAKLVTIDVDLPGFLNQLISEQRLKMAVENRVRGLLT